MTKNKELLECGDIIYLTAKDRYRVIEKTLQDDEVWWVIVKMYDKEAKPLLIQNKNIDKFRIWKKNDNERYFITHNVEKKFYESVFAALLEGTNIYFGYARCIICNSLMLSDVKDRPRSLKDDIMFCVRMNDGDFCVCSEHLQMFKNVADMVDVFKRSIDIESMKVESID